MYVVDTNVVSELRKDKDGKADARVVAWAAGVPAATLFLSVITVLELEQGTHLVERRDPSQGARLRRWLDNQVMPAFAGRILAIDTGVVLRCARLYVPYPKSKRDAFITATALVHGMAVVTRNVADFATTGVAIIDPWKG